MLSACWGYFFCFYYFVLWVRILEELPNTTSYLGYISSNTTNDVRNIQNNVLLLENIMIKNGFEAFQNEWWHFNDIDKYDMIYELFE